jgi:hypothetical protein
VDHRTHLLSQRAASKIQLPLKTEKQTVNSHNTGTAEGANGTLNLPRERGWGKEINPQCGNPSK